MAKSAKRPLRTLTIFFLGVAVIYGLVALAGNWKPALGLDLQGGTRITMTASGDPTTESLEEARRIIDQRVNGSGIVEASVTTQGDNRIQVEVPGTTENRAQLQEMVTRQAQLRFRLVACSDYDPSLCPSADAGNGQLSPDQLGGLGRPAPQWAADEEAAGDEGSEEQTDPATPDGGNQPEQPQQGGQNAAPGDPWDPEAERTIEDVLAWSKAPDQRSIQEYNKYQCDDEGNLTQTDQQSGESEAVQLEDNPNTPLVSCEVTEEGVAKFLLSPAVIEGTELSDASAGIPQGEVGWVVSIDLGNDEDDSALVDSGGATRVFEAISRDLVGSNRLFAITLDGNVISAPTMEAVITNGESQISGNFNEQTATDLANSLKFGALPIAFEEQPTVQEIGPSLAGDQLETSLLAGALGLGLVMLYCLLYYRGLGLVVVFSLGIAAAITYALVLLLSDTAGFTLTLPGMAGFIIAVGIVGDSFILYFERIRDEMREGKSMRVAAETGWARARKTRIAANTVSLLSALVLYIFATGAVKGFGFALGLSTLIDLAVLFWFTKPVVTWLAKFKLFNSGHRLSGLSDSTLGIDGIDQPATAGGRA